MNPIATQLVAALINLFQGKPATITYSETFVVPSEVPVLGGKKVQGQETLTLTPE